MRKFLSNNFKILQLHKSWVIITSRRSSYKYMTQPPPQSTHKHFKTLHFLPTPTALLYIARQVSPLRLISHVPGSDFDFDDDDEFTTCMGHPFACVGHLCLCFRARRRGGGEGFSERCRRRGWSFSDVFISLWEGKVDNGVLDWTVDIWA